MHSFSIKSKPSTAFSFSFFHFSVVEYTVNSWSAWGLEVPAPKHSRKSTYNFTVIPSISIVTHPWIQPTTHCIVLEYMFIRKKNTLSGLNPHAAQTSGVQG